MKTFRLLAWLFLLALLLVFSLINLDNFIPHLLVQQDKLLHLLIFTFLFLLSKSLFPKLSGLKTGLFLVAYGLLLEILQKLLSHGLRHFSFTDILFNVLGIVLGILLFWIYRAHRSDASGV